MSSIKELENTLSPYFTLSNKNLIIIARVREETVYFYDQLGPNTTIILLAEPECYEIKRIFLELMIEMGVTVIDLREKETFDSNYTMDTKSIYVIKNLINEYSYQRIITHPKYKITSDSQNRAIYDLVYQIIKEKNTNNHFVYNTTNNSNEVCDVKKNIIELYCSGNESMYENYLSITSNINGLKKV